MGPKAVSSKGTQCHCQKTEQASNAKKNISHRNNQELMCA